MLALLPPATRRQLLLPLLALPLALTGCNSPPTPAPEIPPPVVGPLPNPGVSNSGLTLRRDGNFLVLRDSVEELFGQAPNRSLAGVTVDGRPAIDAAGEWLLDRDTGEPYFKSTGGTVYLAMADGRALTDPTGRIRCEVTGYLFGSMLCDRPARSLDRVQLEQVLSEAGVDADSAAIERLVQKLGQDRSYLSRRSGAALAAELGARPRAESGPL